MEEFPTASRMPGSDSSFAADEFDAGERAGMRSAGVILLVTAAMGLLLAWAGKPRSLPVTALIDLFLGVQLFRLRHSWRAWALLRAWIGLLLGGGVALFGVFGSVGSAAAVLGMGQVAYAGSVLLLLFGTPTMKRVFAGRVVFGLSIVLMIAGSVLAARALETTSTR